PEAESLRFGLAGAAVPNPDTAWSKASFLSTVDKRVLDATGALQAVRGAERRARGMDELLFGTLRELIRLCYTEDRCEGARKLIEAGERYEALPEPRYARVFYEKAVELSAPLGDRTLHALALRRVGRSLLSAGELSGSLSLYTRSAQLARDSDDLKGEVVGRVGMANALMRQGRWPDAQAIYEGTLAKLDDSSEEGTLMLERGQLFNNLGLAAARQNRLQESEDWLDRAGKVWQKVDSPVDAIIRTHILSVVRGRQGRVEESRQLLEEAFGRSPSALLRAGIAIDLAETCLRLRDHSDALRWGRIAEDHAITAQSADYLARVYRGLGNIARDTGDDGVGFYEKALDIARGRELVLCEAETLLDYARLRLLAEEDEEAVAYLEGACIIFRELGAAHELAEADLLLAERRQLVRPA
ncbi:MAG: tetratricopeptide repeat protein, partial [Gemmatimonadota bacterium]|nr:tetratricopeptide repeat protein [Gemmatimonadota bacterium]